MKEIIIILIGFFVSLKIYTQNLTIVYESFPKYSEEMIEALPNLALEKNKYRYSLQLNSERSVFMRDSVLIVEPYVQSRVEIWQFEKIYKNHKTDKWLKISGGYKDGYGYERSISELNKNNNFQWSKTGVEKEILGFKCVEVVYGDKSAFYAIKIPIPDGPKYGIFGLPGLVLEYEDESGFWKATSIKYSNNTNIIFPNVKTTSKESKIKISVFDLKHLPESKAIRIDNTTPINEWIKFENR